MATDFTAHYHLDKYVATDKPNLRDQYNAAMDKIDDALYTANTNATDAKATANAASQAVSGKASQADLDALSQTVAGKASQTELNTLSGLLPSGQFSAQNTVKAAIDAVGNTATAALNTANAAFNPDAIIVAIGDSYGGGWDPDAGVDHYGWCERLAGICSDYGITLKYAFQGGAGFGNGLLLTKLQAVAATMATAEKNHVKKILVAGGANDWNQSDGNVATGITNMKTYVRTTFPNAIVYIANVGGIMPGRLSGSWANATALGFKASRDNWTSQGIVAGFIVDPSGPAILSTPSYFTSDGIHPSIAGNLEIARCMWQFLHGSPATSRLGRVFVAANEWFTANSAFSAATVGDFFSRISLDGYPQYFSLTGYSQFTYATPTQFTFGASQYITLGTANVPSVIAYNARTPVEGCVYVDNQYYDFSGSLSIGQSGEVLLHPNLTINGTRNNYLSGSLSIIQFMTQLLGSY